jgi:hypothetical protein
MNHTYEHLRQSKSRLSELQKIIKDLDPASGVSFMIRRGPAKDNEEIDDYETKHPWTTIEISNPSIVSVLNILEKEQTEVVRFWKHMTEIDIKNAQGELNS